MREKPPQFQSEDPKKRYPRYVRNKAGNLVREDELVDEGRRHFLGTVGKTVATAAALSVPRLVSEEQSEPERNRVPESPEESETEQKEQIPDFRVPHEQLYASKRVDLEAGIAAVYQEEYEHQIDPEQSGEDMETAAENLKALNMERFVRPFIEQGLPYKLAYMIAIQETRGKTDTSWAGAKGITGIMPSTAEHHGYDPEDVDDPYIASEVTAAYLATERDDRFGEDNMDMLLHAYNGGGGLFGFTASVSREERTPEHFYMYMEEKINEEAAEKFEAGYHVHEFDQRSKSLIDVSELFDMSLEALQEANPDLDPTQMQYGDEIKIPLAHATSDTWREIFRKYFETLYYAPEVKAKYAALKEKGLVSQIEAPLEPLLTAAR